MANNRFDFNDTSARFWKRHRKWEIKPQQKSLSQPPNPQPPPKEPKKKGIKKLLKYRLLARGLRVLIEPSRSSDSSLSKQLQRLKMPKNKRTGNRVLLEPDRCCRRECFKPDYSYVTKRWFYYIVLQISAFGQASWNKCVPFQCQSLKL